MKTLGKASLSSFLLVLVNIGWFCVALALVVTVLFLAAGAYVGVQIDASGAPSVEVGHGVMMSIPVSFSVDSQTHHVSAPSLGIADAQLRDARAALKFSPQRGPFFVANAVLLVGLLSLVLWAVSQLRGVLRTLRDGQPFAPANARRLRRIAWLAIVGELVRAAVVFFETQYAAGHFVSEGLHFSARPEVNVFAIVNGLVILVIAEVFRIGAGLDEEQSLTV
jgi:hypothetical protein